jgi:hypothetical protein
MTWGEYCFVHGSLAAWGGFVLLEAITLNARHTTLFMLRSRRPASVLCNDVAPTNCSQSFARSVAFRDVNECFDSDQVLSTFTRKR